MSTRAWRRRRSTSTNGQLDGRLLLLVGGLFTVAALVLLTVALVTGIRTSTWLAGADRVDGTVVELHRHTSTDDGERSVTYRPEVEYAVGGETHRFVSSTGTNPSSYDIGDTVTVAVSPDDPTDARLTGWSAYLVTMITGALGLGFTAMVSWLWVLRSRSVRRRKRLAEAGGEAWGEIVQVTVARRSGGEPGTSTTVRVVWTDATGIEQVAHGTRVDSAGAAPVEIGDRIRLRCDPADVTNTALEWDSLTPATPPAAESGEPAD